MNTSIAQTLCVGTVEAQRDYAAREAQKILDKLVACEAQRDALAAALRAVLSNYPALIESHRQRAPGSYTLAEAVIANARAALAGVRP